MDKDLESFVGCYDMPLRHGMTFGELAQMANTEQNWHTDLRVIRMRTGHAATGLIRAGLLG